MRIIHVINELVVGGAERILLSLTAEQIKLYEEVCVVLLMKNTSYLEEEFNKNGIRLIKLSHLSFFHKLITLRRLLPQFDCVHVHLFPSQYYAALSLLGSRKKPILVTTEHCTANRRTYLKILKPLEKFIYRQYDKIICVSDDVFLAMEQYLGKPYQEKLQTIPNGIEIEKFQNASPVSLEEISPSITKKDTWIIMIARFAPWKNHSHLIRVIRILVDKGLSIGLICLGKGETKEASQKLISELNLEEHIILKSPVPNVASYMKFADIMVLPSSYEGLPTVLLEGAAASLPIIVSDIPGSRNLARDNENSLLFPEGNEQALAEKIETLIRDKDLRKRLVQQGSKDVQQYSIENMVKRLHYAYFSEKTENKAPQN